MKAESQQVIDQVKAHYQEIVEKAKSKVTQVGLSKIHQACSEIVEHAKEIPSVNQVALVMTRNFGKNNHPAAQTIRNNRKDGNPYKQLFDAWKTAAIVVVTAEQNKARSHFRSNDLALSQSDLHTIHDPTLKLQVTLLLQHNKRLKNQLDILRRVEGKPQIRQIEANGNDFLSNGAQKSLSEELTLTPQEKFAMGAFINEKLMAAKGFHWTKQGALKSANGDMVAKPGVLSAINKMQRYIK
jgi:hypothetical protein